MEKKKLKKKWKARPNHTLANKEFKKRVLDYLDQTELDGGDVQTIDFEYAKYAVKREGDRVELTEKNWKEYMKEFNNKKEEQLYQQFLKETGNDQKKSE